MIFQKSILKILEEIWPMLLICCFILISMRLTYLIKNKKKFVLYKEIISLGFVIYVMCLFYVVTFQDVSWSDSNFIPLKEMFRYKIGTQLFLKNVLGNMIMFVPYGFFVSYFLKLKNGFSMFILTLITSITIEVTQLSIGRVFDIDDIILNLIGGMVGFLLYYIINKIKLPNCLKKETIYNIIVVVLLVFAVIYMVR